MAWLGEGAELCVNCFCRSPQTDSNIKTQIKVSIILQIWKSPNLNRENNGSPSRPQWSLALGVSNPYLPVTYHISPSAMTVSLIPENSFPPPASLTPRLVALGIDNELANNASKFYLSAALTLKEKYEAEYLRACSAFIATSDNRGYSSGELRSKLLTVAITRYKEALSRWGEAAVEKANVSLRKRDGRDAVGIEVGSRPNLAEICLNSSHS